MSSLMRSINQISRCASLFRADRLKGGDITACHHAYFMTLSHHPGISQEELAKHICVNKSGVARQLAQLEELGYVRRQPDAKDKRVLLVYPTEKMEEAMPKIRGIAADWNGYLAECLSEEEKETFLSLVERLSERAKEYADRREEIKE